MIIRIAGMCFKGVINWDSAEIYACLAFLEEGLVEKSSYQVIATHLITKLN
jgi:hypothetical protein